MTYLEGGHNYWSPEYIHRECLVDGWSGGSLLLELIVVRACAHVKLTRVNLTPCMRLGDPWIGRHFGEGEPCTSNI